MKLGEAVRTAPSNCPACGKRLDAGSVLGEEGRAEPTPGAWCMCFACGAIAIYDQLMRFRVPTGGEVIELAEEFPEGFGRLLAARAALRSIRREGT